MNLWQNLKHFFCGSWSFHTINKVTQSTLAPLFVNGLCSKISGLIKRQKIRWETISLTELLTKLLTIAEQLGPWSNIANKICQAINFIATIVPRSETPNNTWASHLHPFLESITKILVYRLMSQL